MAYRTDFEAWDTPVLGQCITSGGSCKYHSTQMGEVDGFPYSDYEVPECVVTYINPLENWFSCVMSFTYQFPAKTATYKITLTGQNRLSSLNNNADEPFEVSTQVYINANNPISSPVSNSLPIINVCYNQDNPVQFLASSPAGLPLTYSLSPDADLGNPGGWFDDGTSQPSGLTITSGGLINFKPTYKGLYSAQVRVSDGNGWIAVDFLLNSIVCQANVNPVVIRPNKNNNTFTCSPGVECVWQYEAMSPISSRTVTMQESGGLPLGVIYKSGNVAANPFLATKSWKPTVSQIGTYVVAVKATDNQGVQSVGQETYILQVRRPDCVHGHKDPSKPNCDPSSDATCCICDDGWSGPQCTECDTTTHHGPNCIKNDPCFNGTSNSGPTGDGTCNCFLGYTGPACNISIVQYCNPGKQNGVTFRNATIGYLNPSLASVYLANTSPFTIPFKAFVPSPMPSLNVYVILDVAPLNSYIGDDLTQITNLVSMIQTYTENAKLGLGFFSDALQTGVGYNFQSQCIIGCDIPATINGKVKYTVSTASRGNSLASLTEAVAFPLGWVSGEYRSVIIVTDSDINATSTDISALGDKLRANFINPTIVGLRNVNLKNWKAAIQTIGFGTVNVSQAAGADWTSVAFNSMKTGFTQYAPSILAGTDKFNFATAPSTFTSTNTEVNLPLIVTRPAVVPSAPSNAITLTVPGYGQSIATVNYNHPPVANDVTLATNKDTAITFQISVSDADLNQLDVSFTNLPSAGQLTVVGGSAVVVSTPYLSTTTFKYTPDPTVKLVTFDYTVTDRCDTDTGKYTINIQGAGVPPVALYTNNTLFENSQITFDFKYTNTEGMTGPIQVVLVKLPTNGDLLDSTGAKITSIATNLPTTLTYRPNKDISNDDTFGGAGPVDTIPFSIFNAETGLMSTAPNKAEFYVTPRKPPVYTGVAGFRTNENQALTFAITSKKPANAQRVVLTITSITPGNYPDGGILNNTGCLGMACNLKVVPPYEEESNDGTFSLTYQPPANQYGDFRLFANFTLSSVIAGQRVPSESIMVYFNVTQVLEAPIIVMLTQQEYVYPRTVPVDYVEANPITKFATPLNLLMNNVIMFNFTTMSYDAPNSTIQVIFTQLPKRGSIGITNFNTGSLASDFVQNKTKPHGPNFPAIAPGTATYSWFYEPNSNQSGLAFDSVSFYAIDEYGLMSATNTIVFNVNKKFNPPIIFADRLEWMTLVNQNLVVTNVSFIDPDVTYQNVTLTVSLLDNNGNFSTSANISLLGNTAPYCTYPNASSSITCVGTKELLNKFLSQITLFHKSTGNFTLHVSVLNHMFMKVPGISLLDISAQKELTISVKQGSNGGSNNTTILSIAIAAAIVAAAIIALGVWRLVRALAPPTSAFFGDSPFADGAITSNPLYTESANQGVNPLYENH
ncbi:hypothetical protein SAMD00019534_031820 [Acytostelium subglobosum LB1]|uniref:hypothetical protein n=1 Tax=Acytostelium subglobosum LB1 TaxID=1410327 RepID=UPI000644C076|nr:hypothetical protein SAMD00019534_031820 [Acytostelium subglobosum LB1]GAM20007.1 hypothetical protein SAMD00019534_031820 [Acytostelium subglobosum LB1]|eukprot:XP_012756769.1 hypothetical protein SAMD00019534_031820 [Acytostelium subglobosum LB1]